MRRGFSLIEILLGSAITLALALVALSVFRLLGQASRETTSSYLISRDLEEAHRILRTDLRQTALASVRIYPRTGTKIPPSLTCISALDNTGVVRLGEDGVPDWQAWVTYRLLVDGNRGRLVRSVRQRPGSLATIAPIPDLSAPSGDSRTILNNVVVPGTTIQYPGAPIVTGDWGGFHPSFVRLNDNGEYEYSNFNPAQVTAGEAPGQSIDGNTFLVQVRLAVADSQNPTKVSYLELPIRVSPRF